MFIALLTNLHKDSVAESLYELSERRADFLIRHALEGFDMDIDEATQLLKAKNDNTLVEKDKEKLERLIAAITNLAHFAVAEEYQLWDYVNGLVDDDDDIDFNGELYGELEAECEKRNKIYAIVENEDVKYAMAMASWWVGVGRRDYLMYMTQGDDRVRPWHAALEGFTARRDDFPSWMIPPIEWGCRCYLVDMAGDAVQNSAELRNVMAKTPDKPSQLNDIFSESVCKCGKIFGDAHPYFNIKAEHQDMLSGFVSRIIEKWNG